MAQITNPKRLLDKVCVVTGSSSGLGRAIALAYAREGGHLVCIDLQQNARAEVDSEQDISTDELIRQNGGRAIFARADVSKTGDVENAMSLAVSEYGRIDVLVNNAGISIEAGREPLRIHETPEHWWDLTMAVNTKSVFLTSKTVISQMLRQEKSASGDRGWILNISSIFGLVGGQYVQAAAAYSASKGAVSNLTKQIAIDYAEDGIHCNAICPGFTNTAIFLNTIKKRDIEGIQAKHPLHGIGLPDDIAGAAVFLASGEARWITGVCLPVDGGYTAQ